MNQIDRGAPFASRLAPTKGRISTVGASLLAKAPVQALQGDRLTPCKRMRQCPAIHQFQLPTQWHTMSDARSDQAFVAEQLGDVMRRGLAFHRRVGGENDFGERARLFYPGEQLRNADGFRPKSVEGRQMTLEHKVAPTEAGLLHRIDVHWAFDHA